MARLAGVGSGLEPPSVTFDCACSTNAPLTHLFLCQHCIKLRCARCVTHEIESYYCPYCLETMSSAEAKVKKNRCGNCCDCPSCGHTLSVMSTSTPADGTDPAQPSPGPSPTSGKKVFYLRCAVCRWSSRDVDMPDKDTAGGGYPIEDVPAKERVAKLVDLYRRIVNMEKAEWEQKVSSRRRNLLTYTAALDQKLMAYRSQGSQALLSVRPGDQAPAAGEAGSTDSVLSELSEVASKATGDIEPLPDSYYSDPLRLESVAMLEQRLSDVAFQSPCASVRALELEGTCMANERRLVPQHKSLCTRRLQRCKECEHILNKPDNNPSSIKTRLQLIALHYMPTFRIAMLPRFTGSASGKGALTIVNPLNDNVVFTLTNLSETEDNQEPVTTADIELPTSQLTVLARDDTSEYDDTDAEQFQDDPSIVHRRKANRLSFYIQVKPHKAIGPVKASFFLCFKYTSAVQKGSQPVQLRQRVNINFGDRKDLNTTTKS